MTIDYLYVIEWADGDTEVYERRSDRTSRVHILENVGFVVGDDFTLHTIFAED